MTLSATDNCSGVASTEYSLDGATWQPYAGSFTISTEGATTVSFRSTDRVGNVETIKTLIVMIDKTAPVVSLVANPEAITPPNGKMVPVTLTLNGTDAVSGLASVSYTVTDEYGASLSIPTRSLTGNSASWTETLLVEARREGSDRDGRLYTVTATLTDVAGHTSTATANIVVSHDQRNR